MARGGKRPGAGRRVGAASERTREIADKAIQGGNSPLEYMLAVMTDAGADNKRRDAMAIAAAPFIHPRLQAVELAGDKSAPAVVMRLSWIDSREKKVPDTMRSGTRGADRTTTNPSVR